MKIKSATLIQSMSLPGTKISADFTLNATKQPGIKLELNETGTLLLIELNGKKGATTTANIRELSFAEET